MKGQTADQIEDDQIEDVDAEIDAEDQIEDESDENDDQDQADDQDSYGEVDDESDDDEGDDESEDDVIVSIGEESPPQDDGKPAPEWVKELRRRNRETQRENRELKAKLDEMAGAGDKKPVELGKKPTLEDCDYDTDAYDQKLAAWYENKRKHDEAEEKKRNEAKQAEQEWNNVLKSYATKKSELKVRDFDDAEEVVQENFSTTQQGMIIQGADNPALVIYALGKNPNKAKELSAIKDPVKFAFAVAKLETQMKVTNRKAATKPEKTVSGTARVSGTVDSTLDRLRAEAEKTGDYSKVFRYRQQRRNAKK